MNSQYFDEREKCPACASGELREIYSSYYDKPPVSEYLNSFYADQGGVEFEYLCGASYTLCECCVCKMIFQKSIPNEMLMGVLYEEWIDAEKVHQLHKETDDIEMYSVHASEISMIISFLDKVPSTLKILDFGMGWAQWAMMARGFGCESWGAELSQNRIQHATDNGIKVLEWEDIPQQQFDFINTEQVFEHIADPLGTLCHLKKGLKSDGILKISVPTANDIDNRLVLMDWDASKGSKNSLNPIAPLEHINYFRRSSLLKMAELAGMEEVRIPLVTQYRFTTNWKGFKRVAKNLLNPLFRNVILNRNYMFFRCSN